MVLTAGVALAGVCVLGLYLGIQPSLERTADADQAPASSAAPTPGISGAVQAVPLKTDTPLPSSAPAASSGPAQLAQAGKAKKSDDDEDAAPSSDVPAVGAQAGRQPNAPEPPTLYSPDEPPAPAPAGGNNPNTPPY
jgi:hypothetical protein